VHQPSTTNRRRIGNVRYLFEDFEFDTDRRELQRGTDVIAVAPKVFDLLNYLIDRTCRQQGRPHKGGLGRPRYFGCGTDYTPECRAERNW
jgi:hypothetical protein